MSQNVATASLELNTKTRIPQVGLGVWQAPRGDIARGAVAAALQVGYRHVDTAAIYGNEADVGRAVRESGIAREEISSRRSSGTPIKGTTRRSRRSTPASRGSASTTSTST